MSTSSCCVVVGDRYLTDKKRWTLLDDWLRPCVALRCESGVGEAQQSMCLDLVFDDFAVGLRVLCFSFPLGEGVRTPSRCSSTCFFVVVPRLVRGVEDSSVVWGGFVVMTAAANCEALYPRNNNTVRESSQRLHSPVGGPASPRVHARSTCIHMYTYEFIGEDAEAMPSLLFLGKIEAHPLLNSAAHPEQHPNKPRQRACVLNLQALRGLVCILIPALSFG